MRVITAWREERRPTISMHVALIAIARNAILSLCISGGIQWRFWLKAWLKNG